MNDFRSQALAPESPTTGWGPCGSYQTHPLEPPFTDPAVPWGDGAPVTGSMLQIPDHAPSSVSVENQFPEDLYDAM
ncbi:MAG: hypothetical protein VKK63_00710, partial [Synechococcus sp.]|nr:hypothetical protein [Synechococcus sp.]